MKKEHQSSISTAVILLPFPLGHNCSYRLKQKSHFYFPRETRLELGHICLPLSWPEAEAETKVLRLYPWWTVPSLGIVVIITIRNESLRQVAQDQSFNSLTSWVSINRLKKWFDMATIVKKAQGSFQGLALVSLSVNSNRIHCPNIRTCLRDKVRDYVDWSDTTFLFLNWTKLGNGE